MPQHDPYAPPPKRQLVHLVIGGELKRLNGPPEFENLSNVDFVGAFANYRDAYVAWRGAAQRSVDNARMRYFVIHAHNEITPGFDPAADADDLAHAAEEPH